MNTYKYKGLSPGGEKIRGVVEAYDEFEAVAKIKTQCAIVLDIVPVKRRRTEPIDLNEPLWVSGKVLSLTASQFAILLRAGMPVVRAVELVAGQTTDRLMKRILKAVAEDVAAGYGLAQSLESRGKKIPPVFIETVRAGEESGTLEACFEKLAVYFEKAAKTRSKVRGAMIYPTILMVLAVVVIAIVVTVTVPVMRSIIEGAGGQLPLPTRILLGITAFFSHWWWLVLILLVAAITGLLFYGKTEKGSIRFSQLALKLPVLGNVNRLNAATQFASTMTALLAAGMATSHALQITGKVLDNRCVGLAVGAATVGIEEGKSLGQVLSAITQLPPLLTEMASVGEASGSLEDTLQTIAAYYDSELQTATDKALKLMEPIITIVMGLVIGFIVIALYLPMFTMYGSM